MGDFDAAGMPPLSRSLEAKVLQDGVFMLERYMGPAVAMAEAHDWDMGKMTRSEQKAFYLMGLDVQDIYAKRFGGKPGMLRGAKPLAADLYNRIADLTDAIQDLPGFG